MNYHSDEWIMNGIRRHYEEALTLFPEDRIVGIFAQGSMNYGLDYEGSDIDTKCIVLPTLEDLIFNRKPVSTTHVLPNEEHLDLKDVRLYFQTFRKQNLNFMEILFTKYKIVNPTYEPMWNRLIENNEQIARYNPVGAVKTMKGIALEKYHALKHPYPSKLEVLAKYGYDPKQLHHLLRVEDYLERYINGESYEKCLRPTNPEFLLDVKKGCMDLAAAEAEADRAKAHVEQMAAAAYEVFSDNEDPIVNELLDEVQLNIMRKAIGKEFE